MHPMTEHNPAPRSPSPWSGSRHETQHRWQLDGARSLPAAAEDLHALATELTAAHEAGWALVEPMRDGHLLATRASRRKRAQVAPEPRPAGVTAAPAIRWRLRVVDEPPLPGDEVLHLTGTAAAERTSVLAPTGRSLRQLSGPPVSSSLLEEVTRQLLPTGLGRRLWGLAPARVGPSVDLVADGSALRLHAVCDGALVRTQEALAFQHAADGATTLLAAAAAYERIARAAEAMVTAGGRLLSVDDGRLFISYARR
jgi:hypothetical protein